MANEYRLAVGRHNAAEHAGIAARKAGQPAGCYSDEELRQQAVLTMVQHRGPNLQAASARDALFQVTLALSEVDCLATTFRLAPAEMLNKEHAFSPENTAIKIERMLRSVGRYLEAAAGTTVHDLCDGYHGSLDELGEKAA